MLRWLQQGKTCSTWMEMSKMHVKVACQLQRLRLTIPSPSPEGMAQKPHQWQNFLAVHGLIYKEAQGGLDDEGRDRVPFLCLGDESGGHRESVVLAGVSQVVCEVLNGSLASSNGLDKEAEHGEHSKPAILDFLHLHNAAQMLQS